MSKASKDRYVRRQVGKALVKNLQTRSCGDCTVCCTVMGVKALDKPVDVTCQHLYKGDDPGIGSCSRCGKEDGPCNCKGCGIYAKRPSSCKEFHCAWRHSFDFFPEFEGRPDRLGVMFDMATAKVFPGGAFVVRESREGAVDAIEADLWEIAERDGIVFFVVKGQEARRIIANDANMSLARELARRTLPVVPS